MNGIYHLYNTILYFLFIIPFRYFTNTFAFSSDPRQDNPLFQNTPGWRRGTRLSETLCALSAVEFDEKWKTVELPTTVS